MKTLTKWQQLKREREASIFPDIELVGFVSRGKLIVLQTSPDGFEIMSKDEKLNSISFMQKSLDALKDLVETEKY